MNGLTAPPLPRRRDIHARNIAAPETSGISTQSSALLTSSNSFSDRPIWLMFEAPDLEETVEELCLLAQCSTLRVQRAASVEEIALTPGLLITDSPELVPAGLGHLQRVVVGSRSPESPPGSDEGTSFFADVEIPGDEVALVRLLEHWGHAEASENQAYLLLGWHGGGGVTATALRLAHEFAGVVIDASGNYGIHDYLDQENRGQAVVLEDLDPQDLPTGAELVSALPRVGSTPVLTVFRGPPATPGSEKVEAVAANLPGTVVIDCGTLVGEALSLHHNLGLAGTGSQLVLVGSSDVGRMDSLTHVLFEVFEGHGEVSEEELSIVLRDRPNDLFRAVISRFTVHWRRAPRKRSVRGWNSLARGLACEAHRSPW